MEIDQRVVLLDLRVIPGDEAHSSRVRGQCIHLVDARRCSQAVLPIPQIKQLEFIGVAGRKLRTLEVDSPDPIALCPKKRNEMVSDKPACAGYQNLNRMAQCSFS